MAEFNKKQAKNFDGFNNIMGDSDSDNDYEPQELEEEEEENEDQRSSTCSNNFEGFNNLYAENENNDDEFTNDENFIIDNGQSYYSLFFAAFQEISIPSSNHSSNEDLNTIKRLPSKKSVGLFDILLKTVEKFNMPSLESNDSLSSLNSFKSFNSLASISSETDLKSLLSEGNYFKAMEKVYLNEKVKSSPNLQSLSSPKDEEKDSNNTMISQFVTALEDFLQQSNQTTENFDDTIETLPTFPKIC
jgi:hypothetical protein